MNILWRIPLVVWWSVVLGFFHTKYHYFSFTRVGIL
jgi:hypothetical protein